MRCISRLLTPVASASCVPVLRLSKTTPAIQVSTHLPWFLFSRLFYKVYPCHLIHDYAYRLGLECTTRARHGLCRWCRRGSALNPAHMKQLQALLEMSDVYMARLLCCCMFMYACTCFESFRKTYSLFILDTLFITSKLVSRTHLYSSFSICIQALSSALQRH